MWRGVDLSHARPHNPGEIKQTHAGRDREARERVTQVVDAVMLDPGSRDRRCPMIAPPLLALDVTASRGGKEEGRIETWRQGV